MFDRMNFWGEDALDDLHFGEKKLRGAKHAMTRIRVIEIGRTVCFGGKGGGGSAPAPDPMIGVAAVKNVELGQNWLDFAKQQFAVGNERQAATDDLNSRVIEQQLSDQQKAAGRSDQQWSDYNATYRPIEQQNALDAVGGQYMTDDQAKDYLSKQNARRLSQLDADYQAKLAQINTLGQKTTSTSTSSSSGSGGISRSDAEAMANSILGAAPQAPSGSYEGWYEQQQANDSYKNQLDAYNSRRNDLISRLTGLGGSSGQNSSSSTTTGLTEAELQKLRDAETAKYNAAKQSVGDVTDQVIAQRQAQRGAESNAAAQAKADVQANAAVQNQSNIRQMASMGINPNSGRFAGISRAQDTNTALAAAGAQNNARTMVKNQGIALRADQANYGRGGSSVAAQQAGLGLNAGNSAVATNSSGNQNFYQNAGVMGQGFQGAIGANNSAGNMLNNLYGNQLNAWSAQQQQNAASAAGTGQMIGTLGGAALMVF